MKIFRKKKEEKKPEIEQQEVVQEVVEKAEEEFKTIKEQKADEGNIRQKAIELTAKRILQIFKDSPRYMQYVQDIAKNLAEESELPTEVVVEMIKGTIEQKELPNSIAEEMAQILPDEEIVSAIESDDNLKLKHKEVLAAGIGDKETRLEVEKDIRTQKEIAEEQRTLSTLNELYENCENIPERILTDKIKGLSIQEKTESIQKILDKIVARKIADDYSKFGSTMLDTLKNIVSVEDMYEYHIADLAQEEYQDKISRGIQTEKSYNKRDFEDNLLKHMAGDIARKFFATSKYIIPPLKRFRSIEKREKDLFLSGIQKETSKTLTKMQIADIEGQMQGIIGTNADIEDLAEKLFETPKMKAKNIINVAGKMTNEDDRNYNTIMALQESGLLETLTKMPRDKREKYIEAFSRFMQDREIRNQQKRKAGDNQEKTVNQQQNDGQVKSNTEQKPEMPDTHGEENR